MKVNSWCFSGSALVCIHEKAHIENGSCHVLTFPTERYIVIDARGRHWYKRTELEKIYSLKLESTKRNQHKDMVSSFPSEGEAQDPEHLSQV